MLSSTYQSTDSPLLSTFYKPLFKHLISVLGVLGQECTATFLLRFHDVIAQRPERAEHALERWSR